MSDKVEPVKGCLYHLQYRKGRPWIIGKVESIEIVDGSPVYYDEDDNDFTEFRPVPADQRAEYGD
jgi:hypothetical protein